MRDIGKRAAVDEGRILFQRLHQVGPHGFFQQHRHRAFALEIADIDQLAGPGAADHGLRQAARQIVKDNYLADGGEPQGSKGQADDPRMFDAGPKDLFTKPKHDDFNPVDFGSKDCYLRKGRVVLLPMHLFNKPWRDGMSDSSAPRPEHPGMVRGCSARWAEHQRMLSQTG